MVQKSLTEEDGKYDRIMGEGAAQEVLDCIGMRFNMDGGPIPGRRVGLLDKHHLWCYFMDPFNHLWRSTFKIEGGLRVNAKEMIAHFVPLYAPRALLKRDALLEEFLVSMFIFHLIKFVNPSSNSILSIF